MVFGIVTRSVPTWREWRECGILTQKVNLGSTATRDYVPSGGEIGLVFTAASIATTFVPSVGMVVEQRGS